LQTVTSAYEGGNPVRLLRVFGSSCVGVAAIGAFLWSGQIEARAATDIYMKCTGIQGSSLSAKHPNWIDLLTFNYNITAGAHPAAGSGMPVNAPVSSIVITKVHDAAASPQLMQAAITGKKFATCTVELDKAARDPFPYLTYTLHDVGVSNYDASAGGGGATEKMTLSPSRIEVKDLTQCADGRICSQAGPSPSPSPSPLFRRRFQHINEQLILPSPSPTPKK
jgi:type VI secretion system secreted protein Hcp